MFKIWKSDEPTTTKMKKTMSHALRRELSSGFS